MELSFAAIIILTIVGILSMTGTSQASIQDAVFAESFAKCEKQIESVRERNRAIIEDNSSSRLHFTWFSEGCELRPGPLYMLRKYTFFPNGTFYLIRYHYLDEFCSVAMYTVLIRGSMRLLESSTVVSGATETRVYVDAVNIIPVNREIIYQQLYTVLHNVSCGPKPVWKLYQSNPIFEESLRQGTKTWSNWHSPKNKSRKKNHPRTKHIVENCLKSYGIELGELRLFRVEESLSLYSESNRFELFLGGVAHNPHSGQIFKPTSLQPMAMIRNDTIKDCMICKTILQGTETSVPVLHQVPELPTLIGGYWISERCESVEGGVWSMKQFQIYSGDKLWSGRWDYYKDSQCSLFLYTLTVAGNYAQQPEKSDLPEQNIDDYFGDINISKRSLFEKRSAPVRSRDLRRDNSTRTENTEKNGIEGGNGRSKRSLTDNAYQFSSNSSRFMIMLQGRQKQEVTTKRSVNWTTTTGPIKLNLFVTESNLILRDAEMAARCGINEINVPFIGWPRNCVPDVIEAPATLKLRAKLILNWKSRYNLLLGSQNDHMWQVSLGKCSHISPHNPALRLYLGKKVGLRFGVLPSASQIPVWNLLSMCLILLTELYRTVIVRYMS